MLRFICAIASTVACVLVSNVAMAEDYVDANDRFKVVIPAGWKSNTPPDATMSLFLVSPRAEQSQASCALGRKLSDETKSMSQAQVNEAFEQGIDEAFWRAIVEDKQTKDVAIEATSELRDGRRIFRATVRFTSIKAEGDTKEQARFILRPLPGATYAALCRLLEEFVAAEDADLRTIFDTFEPIPGLVASLPPKSAPPFKPARLTLFAGPRFDGREQMLTEDAPNLAEAGWSGAAGSLKVTGYGLWQVCDGVAFQGNCRLVYGAEGVAFGDPALRIASARRVVDPHDPRNILGVVSDELAAQLKQPTRRR